MNFYDLDLATRIAASVIAAASIVSWFSIRSLKAEVKECADRIQELESIIEKPLNEEREDEEHMLDRMFKRMDETETLAEAKIKMERGEEPIYELNRSTVITEQAKAKLRSTDPTKSN